jgi:hypothetical protein
VTPGRRQPPSLLLLITTNQVSWFRHPRLRVDKMVGSGNALNGVVIGLLSSFASALLIAIISLGICFFRYTASGRIFLDRIGRPGEYDDEQRFAAEEAEALETMDEMQRTEYLRAKGIVSPLISLLSLLLPLSYPFLFSLFWVAFDCNVPPDPRSSTNCIIIIIAFITANPPESAQTDISLSQYLAIQEKGVSAWEFEPELEIANCFVEGRTEIEFFDSECTVMSNLPVPKQNEVYYWEAKIYDKPENTTLSIGMATKPYPLFRLPGMLSSPYAASSVLQL